MNVFLIFDYVQTQIFWRLLALFIKPFLLVELHLVVSLESMCLIENHLFVHEQMAFLKIFPFAFQCWNTIHHQLFTCWKVKFGRWQKLQGILRDILLQAHHPWSHDTHIFFFFVVVPLRTDFVLCFTLMTYGLVIWKTSQFIFFLTHPCNNFLLNNCRKIFRKSWKHHNYDSVKEFLIYFHLITTFHYVLCAWSWNGDMLTYILFTSNYLYFHEVWNHKKWQGLDSLLNLYSYFYFFLD